MRRRDEHGTVEYAALVDELQHTVPPCHDDWRYLTDRHELDDGDVIRMRSTCRRCPLSSLCAAYAETARPIAGMWAGKYYGKPRKDDQ